MSRPSRFAVPLLLLVVLFARGTGAEESREDAAAEPASSSTLLAQVVDEAWQHRLDQELGLRLKRGLPIHLLPDVTYDHARQEADFAGKVLDRLAAIDPAGLSHEEWITREVLRWEAQQTVDYVPWFWYTPDLTPYSSPLPGVHQALAAMPVRDAKELRPYLFLLKAYARLLESLRVNLDERAARGFRLPKEEVDQVLASLAPLLAEPERTPFWVGPERMAGVPPGKQRLYAAQIVSAIRYGIQPTAKRLIDRLAGTYREEAPATVGLGQFPGGDGAYRYLVRYHTTLDLTPEAVHQRGVDAVARLEARMAAARRVAGFKGTQAQFLAFLRADPRFLAKTPEEVGERLMAHVRAIEPKIPRFFLATPKAPYGVRRLEPALEGGMTFGYYQWPTAADPKGYYCFNGSRLDQRPLVGAAALIFHELVPGHHFQIALQEENEALPELRRETFQTAFVEGWAEYASELGIEMGLYDDTYDLYGRLLMDMFLSARLVVDTGMNARGWSLQQAADYLSDRVLETPTQVHTELLRYSTDVPAQALAYKIGSDEIWALRRKAEAALGPRFDLRRFHQAILGSGSMPLAVLDRHVDWWIEQERARLAADPI